jgi:fumarate reductase flavoprotein subunit
MSVLDVAGAAFASEVPVLIVGGGAAGLCAALAAHEAGAECVVVERDAVPRGSTALSAGLIPAAGTRFQRERGIADDAERFAADIMRKARNEPAPEIVALVARSAAPLVEWLADAYGLDFSVVDDFDYPGHSARRMHGLPSRSGAELVDRLRGAVENAGIPIVTRATVTTLFAEADGRVRGVAVSRPDGSSDAIGCEALVLACSGFGGNPELIRRHIREMSKAIYFGHAGNRGDAILWGKKLGAKLAFMSGYQGHGSVAHPHGILITWAVITEGGFQVDAQGRRFANEATGYSEQAQAVLEKAQGMAFDIFDERIAGVARQFDDFRNAEAAGAVISATKIVELATHLDLPASELAKTFDEVSAMKRGLMEDPLGRSFSGSPELIAPFKAVKVTGALFHTQGGLVVNHDARVLKIDGSTFPNLLAAGGAAAGVSGSTAAGYLSGNGLLTATVLGRKAGEHAAVLLAA